MFNVILLCFLTCCSSLMPLKQCDSIISEDYSQVIESKRKSNYFSGQDGVNFVASDFLSYDFGRIFYDYIKDFESPRTENLSYNRSYNPINYEFISDSPIGHLHYGGFSRNVFNCQSVFKSYVGSGDLSGRYELSLINSSSFSYYRNLSSSGNPSYMVCGFNIENLKPNTTYTISVTGSKFQDIQIYFDNVKTFTQTGNEFTQDLVDILYTFTTPSSFSNSAIRLLTAFNNVAISTTSCYVMLNEGSSSLPYEPFFTGVVQYSSLPCYSFTLDKELLFNSQYNGYCYHYVLKFYSRNPNGRPLLFGVDSYVIPHLKWEDNQGNLYGDNFYVTSSMIFNNDLNYNLNNFVYSERSDDSYKPLLNCYVNNFTKEFSSDDYLVAYNEGYDTGYNNGNNYGYQNGYNDGYSDGLSGGEAGVIFTGILDVAFIPVNIFFLMFNYEVFGINIAGFVSGLLTIAIVLIIFKFILGRKL